MECSDNLFHDNSSGTWLYSLDLYEYCYCDLVCIVPSCAVRARTQHLRRLVLSNVISAAETSCPLILIWQSIIRCNLLLHIEKHRVLVVVGAKWMFALLAWALIEMSSFSPRLGL